MPALIVSDTSLMVSVPYFARATGLGRQTVYDLANRGEIRGAVRLGRRILIPRVELNRLAGIAVNDATAA